MNLFIFTQASMQNYTLGFYHTTAFESIFSPVERGRIMELKKRPKLDLQRYWLQVLINSTFFQPLHFWFLFCSAII